MNHDPQAALTIVETFPSAIVHNDESQYADLLSAGVRVDGHDLVEKELLTGVPFLITAVTYRDGVARRETRDGKKAELPTNYVSVEIMVGSRQDLSLALARKRITADQHRYLIPLERLVFNDGSTGIARQITYSLARSGAISLPDGPEGGPAGESRYDTYRADWLGSVVPLRDIEGQPLPSVRFEFEKRESRVAPPLVCPRGLRRSPYDAGGKEAETYYLG